jgi:hypothetical protein
MTRLTLKRIGLAVACGLLGLVVNLWRTGSNAPLLAGRILTLPIAILFGPWIGAFAALIPALAARGVFSVAIVVLPKRSSSALCAAQPFAAARRISRLDGGGRHRHRGAGPMALTRRRFYRSLNSSSAAWSPSSSPI